MVHGVQHTPWLSTLSAFHFIFLLIKLFPPTCRQQSTDNTSSRLHPPAPNTYLSFFQCYSSRPLCQLCLLYCSISCTFTTLRVTTTHLLLTRFLSIISACHFYSLLQHFPPTFPPQPTDISTSHLHHHSPGNTQRSVSAVLPATFLNLLPVLVLLNCLLQSDVNSHPRLVMDTVFFPTPIFLLPMASASHNFAYLSFFSSPTASIKPTPQCFGVYLPLNPLFFTLRSLS